MRRQGRIINVMLVALLAVFVLADTDAANGAEQGFRIVRGEGSVCASGNGIIQFHGSGSLYAKVEKGQMIISDETAVVQIRGEGTKHRLPNGWVLGQGFNGLIRLEGEDVFCQIIGKGVRALIEGEGIVMLAGKGVYRSPCDAAEEPWEYFDPEGVGIELGEYLAEPEELLE
jgi:hypothetical protein